jgi:hypothetical protein
VSPRGAEETSAGVTAELALEGTLKPTEFVAVVVNVYEVPLSRPTMMQEVELVMQVEPPGDVVTV